MNNDAIGSKLAAYTSQVNQTKTDKVDNTKKSNISSKTYGDPKLSDKAAEYYDQLQKKFHNLDFVLVSKDKKEEAKANAASFANANKMVVLIDEEKIEQMANDENFRKKYEGIISQAATGITQMKSSFEGNDSVKGFGMQINDDGTASYFAVLEKSSAAQKERIEKKAEEKREAKKAEAKEDRKKLQEERLQASKEKAKAEKTAKEDSVVVTASSVDELVKKVNDQMQLFRSDNVVTEAEKQVGQKFDFSV